MEHLKINQDAWNKRTQTHLSSKFYDVAGFLKGACSLNSIEKQLVGDVKGKSLLHLQCHFGQDTLSWARYGANVTGVDLSDNAIKEARSLAEQLNIEAQFIQSDIYEFGETNKQQFDIVFTSYGVLCWLPDLTHWAETISNALKPGGQFYLVEFHPLIDVLTGYDYFPKSTPDVEQEGTYTENCDGEEMTVVTWPHSLSEVINALTKAGLIIEQFDEHPFSPYDCFENLEYIEGCGYTFKDREKALPLVYSIKALK